MIALVWVSLACALLGAMLMSHAGSFFLYVLASGTALVSALFGKGKVRIAAVLLVILSLAALITAYPKFNTEMNRIKSQTRGDLDG